LDDHRMLAGHLEALAEVAFHSVGRGAGVRASAGVPVDEQHEVAAVAASAALAGLGEVGVLDLHLQLEAIVAVVLVVLVVEVELVMVLRRDDHDGRTVVARRPRTAAVGAEGGHRTAARETCGGDCRDREEDPHEASSKRSIWKPGSHVQGLTCAAVCDTRRDMDLGLAGRRALLLGAGRSLGGAAAVALARERASVAVVARTQAAVEQRARLCREAGATRALAIAADAADGA